VTAALFSVGQRAYAAVDVGATTVLVAAGAAALRSSRFPRWLAILALVLAAPAAADAVVGIGVSTGPFAPGGAVDVVTSLGFLVWVAGTSVVLLAGRRV